MRLCSILLGRVGLWMFTTWGLLLGTHCYEIGKSGSFHTGLVNEGREYFTSMTKKYEIQPGVEHYNCMIDLLDRAELIEEAEILLKNSDCRHDQSLWVVLLETCTRCSDYITVERIAKKIIELQPGFHLSYVLFGNIYRTFGR
ncbi:Pentatricopeptide repeat-containing protein [Arachis hypogaea]|nr:Pentatricopeptide repeat-containing protein [Arachis hypogaea]